MDAFKIVAGWRLSTHFHQRHNLRWAMFLNTKACKNIILYVTFLQAVGKYPVIFSLSGSGIF